MRAARLVLTLIGFGLAVIGALRDDRRVVWGAIALLGTALFLRLAARRRPPE